MFEHQFLDTPKLSRITDSGRRVYVTPTGEKYPSVTTVIDAMMDKTGILEWRARVGEKEADRIANDSRIRGNRIHALAELYLKNRHIEVGEHDPFCYSIFLTLKPILNKRVGIVKGIESQLFSHKLKLAGTADLICEYDGKICIVDFKTSTKLKKIEYVHGYILQATLYALMVYEMFGIAIKEVVIIVMCDDEPIPQIFVEKVSDHMKEAIDMVRNYHNHK